MPPEFAAEVLAALGGRHRTPRGEVRWGRPVRDVAEAFGVSVPAIYRALKGAGAGGTA